MPKAPPGMWLVTPVKTQDGRLVDIELRLDGKDLFMLGQAGNERELSILPAEVRRQHADSETHKNPFDSRNHLPVLLGSGLGHALEKLIEYLRAHNGPDFRLAVVDKEEDILEHTLLKQRHATEKNILWVCGPSSAETLKTLSKWQTSNAGRAFFPIVNPFYLRIDRAFYGNLHQALSASTRFNFWSKADYPRFKSASPRILLITSKYFLIGELEAACKRMGIEHYLLRVPDEELALNLFMEQLLTAILTFKPDFALTINHLGVDREGVLQDFLARIKLPLASWFVDNPHLILYHYANLVNPWTTVFTWDCDNLSSLKKMGFENVAYLPLGVDQTRFVPPADKPALLKAHPDWKTKVSFVGNSMLSKVQKRLEHAQPSPALLQNYKNIARRFSESEMRSVREFMSAEFPEFLPDFIALQDTERQLSFEAMLTWEATLQYRLACVRGTLPYKPLIVGDAGWFKLLTGEYGAWTYHQELTYYTDLPAFYPLSDINFNCTSKQMKGAVNQRVFDVPATASFIITDWREQIENLFDPGKEVICYHSPQEAEELVGYYLGHPKEREAIVLAARGRIMAEHCYEHMMKTLITIMRKNYAN